MYVFFLDYFAPTGEGYHPSEEANQEQLVASTTILHQCRAPWQAQRFQGRLEGKFHNV